LPQLNKKEMNKSVLLRTAKQVCIEAIIRVFNKCFTLATLPTFRHWQEQSLEVLSVDD